MGNTIQKGCVYFFRHIGLTPIKIGYSSNASPASRFEQFSTFAPYGSELIGFIMTSDYVNLEKSLHKKYANKRLIGEWFDITDDECKKEIDFYTAIEDVTDKNEFQKAWSKHIEHRKLSVKKDIIYTISEMSKKDRFRNLYKSDSKINVSKTAEDFGVSRQCIHRWINQINS
jgi:hypothetical protein